MKYQIKRLSNNDTKPCEKAILETIEETAEHEYCSRLEESLISNNKDFKCEGDKIYVTEKRKAWMIELKSLEELNNLQNEIKDILILDFGELVIIDDYC